MSIHFCGLILISCFIGTTISSSIAETARIGKFVKIGKYVTIKAYSEIGNFASIGPYSLIEENSHVGSYSNIEEFCSLGKKVEIGDYVDVDSYTIVKDGTTIEDYSTIGKESFIEKNVSIGKHSSIGKRNTIKIGSVLKKYCVTGYSVKIDNSTLDEYAMIGHSAEIMRKAYIGKRSIVRSHALVGEMAVIFNKIEIPNYSVVEPMEVVMRQPSSYDLYRNCELDVSSESVSPDFNKQLGELIDGEMGALTTKCAKPKGKISPVTLPKIISLYLIQYHGYERFKIYANVVQGLENGLLNNERTGPSQYDWLIRYLKNELHFGNDANKDILEPLITDKFVRLLAVDLDSNREDRVEGDTFCRMVEEIRNKTRKVTVYQRNYRSV